MNSRFFFHKNSFLLKLYFIKDKTKEIQQTKKVNSVFIILTEIDFLYIFYEILLTFMFFKNYFRNIHNYSSLNLTETEEQLPIKKGTLIVQRKILEHFQFYGGRINNCTFES